jgi:hypothetical protein
VLVAACAVAAIAVHVRATHPLVEVAPGPRATAPRRIAHRPHVELRAGPFPPLRAVRFALTVAGARGDLALTLLAGDGRALARCRYARGSYDVQPYGQTTLLTCPVRRPELIRRAALDARGDLRDLSVYESRGAAGRLVRPLARVGVGARVGAARPRGFGAPTLFAALALSIVALAAAARRLP